MTEPELSVVVPVWSGPDDIGRHDLGRLLPALAASLGTIGVEAEVLVAAGSRPSSLREVVEAQGAKFVVRDNGGYGDILRAGLVEAKGSWVVTMDADSPHTADFVQTMWANRSTAEVLIGSRYVRGSVAQMPLGRRISRAFSTRSIEGVCRSPSATSRAGFGCTAKRCWPTLPRSTLMDSTSCRRSSRKRQAKAGRLWRFPSGIGVRARGRGRA